MTPKQNKAAKRLTSALKACADSGLQGGVFDGSFCIWPIDSKENPYESGSRFFEVIRKNGIILSHSETGNINLDGGAGT